MATVHGVVGIRLVDNEGVITSHELFAETADTSTLAAVVTAVQAYCAKLDPLTDAAGVNAHFRLDFDSTGLKTGVTVKNPLGNGGIFTFSQQNSPYAASVLVQAFAEAKLTGAKIDLTDTDVVAYVNWLISNGDVLQYTSKAYNALTAFRRFQLSTRKHRREQTKLSTETP